MVDSTAAKIYKSKRRPAKLQKLRRTGNYGLSEVQKPIRGSYTHVASWEPAKFCHDCQAAYPWTERQAAALVEAIDELNQLPEDA